MLKFGTSGIRDITKNLIKDHVATQVAEALSKAGWKELSLGRDGRTGSDKLMNEFVKAFPGTIHNLGITTTPDLASQSGLAVMITASHNPYQYCGFKIYLNHFEQNTLDIPPVPVYHKWDLLPKDIMIDCANGALGHKLHSLGFTNIVNYDGEINEGCGVTHPEFLTKYCQDNKLEIAFAVDGDADRFLMYLHDHVLTGEETSLIIASVLKLKKIVVDETINSGLGNSIELVRCKVGAKNVIDMMRATHLTFGGEKSGHYYFDPNIGASDGIDAIVLISNAYHEIGLAGFQQILKSYRPYFEFYRNVKITDLPTNYEEVIANFTLPKGIRKVIRKSGTEPLLRIMLEGKKEKDVMKAWQNLATQLNLK